MLWGDVGTKGNSALEIIFILFLKGLKQLRQNVTRVIEVMSGCALFYVCLLTFLILEFFT